jgi:hypothetical protein
MTLPGGITNRAVLNFAVDAEFDLQISNNALDPKAEAHALMTLNAYVVDRLREFYSLIADSASPVEPCLTL